MRAKWLFSLAISTATLFLTGCPVSVSGNLPVGSSGQGNSTLYTHAYTSTGAWAGAEVIGTGEGYGCNIATDTDCLTSFKGETDSSGNFSYSTDALPANWDVTAAGDSTCPQGAESGWTWSTDGTTIPLPCGQQVTADTVTCTVEYNASGQETSNGCPSTVTITESTPTFPTSYALDSGTYNYDATNIASYQGTASTSTSITVPAPVASSTNYGLKIITVWDPNTNQVLAAAGFNIQYCYLTSISARLYCEDPY